MVIIANKQVVLVLLLMMAIFKVVLVVPQAELQAQDQEVLVEGAVEHNLNQQAVREARVRLSIDSYESIKCFYRITTITFKKLYLLSFVTKSLNKENNRL
jgi:hypothetical protein